MIKKCIHIFFFLGIFFLGSFEKSHAIASSTLSFTTKVQPTFSNGTINVEVMLTPGTNAVSVINLTIDYDNTKLIPLPNGFAPNTTAFPATLDGPQYNMCNGTQCTMYIALSIGNNPANSIKTVTKVATLNFQAVSTGTTKLGFDTKTQIYSIAAQDQANENVLATANPTTITIGSTTSTASISGTLPYPTIGGKPGTTINLQLSLAGLGKGGNIHPLHPLRKITFYLYNVDTNTLLTKTNSVVFDGIYFVRPVIDLGEVPNGNYQIFIQTPQYLIARLSQGNNSSNIVIQNGQAIIVSPNTLIGGDVAPQKEDAYGDNMLDILDYNAILACYGTKANPSVCKPKIKQATDIDDNGIVDAIDYNIILRGFFQTHQGDTIPGGI